MGNNMYLIKMYREFKKANGIEGGIEDFNKYQDMFEDWLVAKSKASCAYGDLVYSMGIDEDYESARRIAEFNKGIYDTSTISLSEMTETKPIVISPYARTLKNVAELGIELAEGRLVHYNNNVYVAYRNPEDYLEMPNCSSTFGDNIGTLLTQTPFTAEDIMPYLLLLDSDKTIFLGTNGAIDDNDREENIKRILDLYRQLDEIDLIDSTFDSTTFSDSYLATLKLTQKRKGEKVKVLTR